MARRLTKLRELVESIIEQYKEETPSWLDKAEHWTGLIAGAEAAIAAGTPTDYDFAF